jgi:hypothetical protein
MIRTQILLTEEQAAELRIIAAREGVSMAELIRQATARLLAERRQATRAERSLAAVGRYRSGLTDISVNHDAYLNEADR